ncbi:MAG: hypothetical protein F7C82_05950 [Desulfurococcales archaeon]|nr:hypothetical protein [Desulfurococcales archaeon]MCE4621772.1 hypothetical protein [Desulfurococcales archaeon]MCE4626585.1 hypothetical protein [Desulfurococcales archaeon]MCE4629804.1 hypothetical protein [Desulfurococcales archaeon]
MEELDEAIIERALERAEEAARRVIEQALGLRALHYNIQLSTIYDEDGLVRLVVDVSITRPRADKTILNEVIEAAIAVAEKTFESEIKKAMGKDSSRLDKKH